MSRYENIITKWIEDSEEEEDKALQPPYYIILYKDSVNHTHYTTTKDEKYITFLERNYVIVSRSLIEKETYSNFE